MSYIGNTNTTQAFTPAVDFFNGNGSTTAFTLSRPVASVAQVQAVISNVPQNPGSAFTVSGNTITFTSAPPSGTQNIYVYYTSPITQVIAPGQGTVNSDSFGVITNFTTTGNTTLGDATTDTLNVGNGSLVKDASGNLGLGVTPSAWGGSGVRAFQISGYGSIAGSVGSVDIYNNAYYDGSAFKYISTNPATRYSQNTSGSSHAWYNAASGTAGNAITFTQAMTLDASGNLGIGVIPSGWGASFKATQIGVTGSVYANNGNIVFANNVYHDGTNPKYIATGVTTGSYLIGGNAHYWYSSGAGTAGNVITSTQVMTLDSTGCLFVGTTTKVGNPKIMTIASAGLAALHVAGQDTTVNYAFTFYNPSGGGVGGVSFSNTTTTYATSSDYRLKENIQPMTGALAKVAALKPCTYTWKSDGSAGEGFIAHELAEVVPDAVTGEKDAVNEDGSIKPQGIDTSFLVATLTAALQEQQAIIETLTQRITALESK